MDTSEAHDEAEIRRLIDRWAIYRDSGDFDRLATLWHPDGRMMTTWSQVSAADFVARARAAFATAATSGMHILGGCAIDLNGARAVAQTRVVISQRAPVEGVLCDANCSGRFYDLFERRETGWGLVFRQPIYEKDRLDPVDPGANITLDPELLASFPVGYRHLGYMQVGIGMTVHRGLPGLRGPEVEALYAIGADWLSGKLKSIDDAVWH